jgi:hypothetical protein
MDWGLEPALPGAEKLGWPASKESIPGLGNEATSIVFTLPSAKGDIILNFGANQDLGLGPVLSVIAPAAGENGVKSDNSGRAGGPIRLGNITFNQAANSLNVWKSDTLKHGDLSRQSQNEAAGLNAAQSSGSGGWAIAALAALAIMAAMAIGFYENDRDDRQRRRSSRRDRRRHHRAS